MARVAKPAAPHGRVRYLADDERTRLLTACTASSNPALRQAAIADFRFHDLRHSCASYLAMHGASLLDIAAILGHKTLVMVQRYSHLSDGHLRSTLAKMTAAL